MAVGSRARLQLDRIGFGLLASHRRFFRHVAAISTSNLFGYFVHDRSSRKDCCLQASSRGVRLWRLRRLADLSQQAQEGSIAVESAIILPVLLAAVAATIVMGMRLSDQMYLNQAARELGVVLSRVPYMAALTAANGSNDYLISRNEAVTDAGSHLTFLTNGSANCGFAASNYSACTASARAVTSWYAKQIMFLKRMFINDTVTVRVIYAPPLGDANSASGLCMLRVTIQAQANGWLTWAAGPIVVTQSVPYVSEPVPNAGGGCVPSLSP
jgi:hypothetical protein